MFLKKWIFISCILFPLISPAQSVSVNNNGSLPDNSAILDVSSTTKGLLIPRMTQIERLSIASPATGLMVFQTDGNPGYYYNAGSAASPSWLTLGSQWLNNGSKIYYNGGALGIGTDNPSGLFHLQGVDWASTPMILEAPLTWGVGPSLRFKTPAYSYDIIGATGLGAAIGGNCFSIYDNTANAYRFSITPSGGVGIGSVAPGNTRLYVQTSSESYAATFDNTLGGFSGYGVVATSNNGPGLGYGIRTEGGYMGGYLEGFSAAYNGSVYGLYVAGNGTGGVGTRYGIYAYANGGATNWAGYFSGNVHITGTLSKAAGTFKIDHPLDPENKTLSHSFVESPDMLNIYTGNVVTNTDGTGVAELPSYFEALNITYTYQLTVVGQFAQAIVLKEIDGNRFLIKTDKPHVKVSWMVTGVRNDPYAQKNRVVPEQNKSADERGRYLNPEVYNQPTSKAIGGAPGKERL